MKIYKAVRYMENLGGGYDYFKTLMGYYLNKATAEAVKVEEEKKAYVVEVTIEEIEVNED